MAREIDRRLRTVRQLLRKPAEAAYAHGNLTGPQRSAMEILLKSGGMSLKDLSTQLGLSHSTVSGIVDRLEGQGMIERQVVENDRRFSRIVVTKPVRDFLRDTLPGLTIHPLAEALRNARPAERRLALEGVRMLSRILERSEEGE